MKDYNRMPKKLYANIGTEKKDFVVKAGRAQPTKKSMAVVFFGVFWLAFTSIFVVAFLGPLFFGNEVHFESNGVPTVASPDNLGPIILPAMIIGLFVIIGLVILIWGLYSMFEKGGFFVGTPLRLVHFFNGKIRSIDWEQFSGEIEVSGDRKKGNILLKMRTGKMVSGKNNQSRYVPDLIYITAIPNVITIEEICRRRIKENDPTPPNPE